jgi:hypothetical protein
VKDIVMVTAEAEIRGPDGVPLGTVIERIPVTRAAFEHEGTTTGRFVYGKLRHLVEQHATDGKQLGPIRFTEEPIDRTDDRHPLHALP